MHGASNAHGADTPDVAAWAPVKRSNVNKLVFGFLLLPLCTSCSETRLSFDVGPGAITNLKVDDDSFRFTLQTERGPRLVRTELRGLRVISAIADERGRALFEVSVEFGDGMVSVSETAGTDRLWIRQSQTRETIREHFVYNGRSLNIAYPKLDPVTMTKSFALYERGEHERIDPDLLGAFQAFEAFYHQDDALHANPEGELLIATLLAPETVHEIQAARASKTAGSEAATIALGRKNASVYCAIVGVGTGLKCFFGGAANPICLFGAYHSLACGLLEIVCSVWWAC